jgi:lipopolysaccharide/colanic/teichoic acid biosynthesis glycosyltransferase
MKRFLDIFFSGLALIVLSPLLVPIAIALRFTGEGEIFYRQERIGKNGRSFQLLKFATMLKDSPNIGTGLLTTKGDPRVLPLGRILRKTKINELPQLVNIFLGDMSIIGPRPQTRGHVDLYSEGVRKEIFKVLPGLSGIGSIFFRDEERILTHSPKGYKRAFEEDITPYKGSLELWYIEHWSLWTDLKLVLLTICAVIWPDSKLHYKWLHDLPEPPESLQAFF